MSENKTGNKENKTFMILSAIGILMLLDAHTWTTVNIFANIIEYNSFFMPLFVFISGYFFSISSLKNIPGFICKKTKKLIVPFLFWGFFYLILERILGSFDIIQYDQQIDILRGIWRAFTTGQICSLAGPLWFLQASFFTQVIYCLLRKVFSRVWNEWLVLLAFVALGCASISLSKAGWNMWCGGVLLIPLKVGFLLEFYQLGVVYKKYLEELHKKANSCIVMLVAVILSVFLLIINHGNYSFIDLFVMTGFYNIRYNIFPFVSSVLGIAFWTTVSRILEPAIGSSKIVNMISDNTLGILEHHMFCYNIVNVLFWALDKLDISGQITFDVQTFQNTAVYRYEPYKQFGIFYIIAGLSGALLITFQVKRLLKCINNEKSGK